MVKDINGIWIGENATVAIVDDYRISFLRLKKEKIISVLHHNTYGTVGVVYGLGINSDARAIISAKNPDSEIVINNSDEAKDFIKNYSMDKIEYNGNNAKLVYTLYDGNKFELILAEKINMEDFSKINEIDNSLSVEKKMALWGVGKCFEFADGYFNVMIDTQKYSILFSFNISEKWTYCRVGQNGYCKKGRAMLSTVCIRQNQARMIENNLSSIEDYKPIEDCFVVGGCAFPPDGGWYWSLKEVNDDVIYLSGCEDKIYEIRRQKNTQQV